MLVMATEGTPASVQDNFAVAALLLDHDLAYPLLERVLAFCWRGSRGLRRRARRRVCGRVCGRRSDDGEIGRVAWAWSDDGEIGREVDALPDPALVHAPLVVAEPDFHRAVQRLLHKSLELHRTRLACGLIPPLSLPPTHQPDSLGGDAATLLSTATAIKPNNNGTTVRCFP